MREKVSLNFALAKDGFIQRIINNDPDFNCSSFEGFRPTLDTIKAITQDAERVQIDS